MRTLKEILWTGITLLAFLTMLGAFACVARGQATQPATAALPTTRAYTYDADGWSIVTDGPTLFVDPVHGNDAGAGTQSVPVKTFGVALKRAVPNGAILIARGTTLTEQTPVSVTQAGLHVGVYGLVATPRPVWNLNAGAGGGVLHLRGAGQSLTDIDFHQLGHAPGDPGFSATAPAGVGLSVDADNVLVEGCRWRGFRQAVNVIGVANTSLRRDVLVDSFTTTGSPAAGLYTDQCDGLLVEDCILDGNGWYDADPKAVDPGKFEFNHGMYLDDDPNTVRPTPRFKPVVIRNTVVARSAGWGIEGRPGGSIDGCLFLDNGLAGGSAFLGGPAGSMTGNVVTGSASPVLPVGGSGLAVNSVNGNATGNLIVNAPGSHDTAIYVSEVLSNHLAFDAGSSSVLTGNVVHGWPGIGFRSDVPRETVTLVNNSISTTGPAADFVKGPKYWGAEGNAYAKPCRIAGGDVSASVWFRATGETPALVEPIYFDSSRTIESYSKSTGLDGTASTWLRYATAQRKGYWDPRYQASGAVAYFKAGFAMKNPVAVPAAQPAVFPKLVIWPVSK